MRVTDRMLYDRAALDGGAARSRMDQATAQMSSGLRVVQPGDDPAAAGLVTSNAFLQQRVDAIATTAGRASDELQAVDGALDTVSNSITRARELAIQLSNGTYSASDLVGGANEVKGLISTVVSALNVKVGDRYLLGGTVDN